MEVGDDAPRPSEWISKPVDTSPGSIRLYNSMSKHNIIDGVDFGVRLRGINEFTVPRTLFLDKDFGNLMSCLQICS